MDYNVCILVLISAIVTSQDVNNTGLNESEYVQCLQSNCSSNSSRYDHVEPPIPADSTLWCPDGYKLFNSNGIWFHLCRLQACVNFTLMGKEDNFTEQSDMTNSTLSTNRTTVCQKSFTNRFETCPKMRLDQDQYEISNTSLWNLVSNYSVPFGEYYIQLNNAIICDDGLQPAHGINMPIWCMPLMVPVGNYRHNGSTLQIANIKLPIQQNYFQFDDKSLAVHICAEMDPKLVSCKKNLAVLEGDLFTLMPTYDLELHEDILTKISYPLGQYILAEDKSMAYYCPVQKDQVTKEVLYAYGIVSLLSAFCLLLALLAHLFYPHLNYHTKSLLCLAFSLFITYLAIAIRNFQSNNVSPGIGNVVLFAFQYIFALGAFFWLNVLAFDLWRVFSKLKGITPGGNKAKKRLFLVKCVYAWGIPVVLCATVIGISYNTRIQRAIYVDLKFEQVSWFQETTSCVIFFYAPIIIILVENVIFFILTIVNIRRASSGTDIVNKRISRKLFKVYIKLFLVMGIFWIAEVIAWFAQDVTQDSAWYFTDILNSLQGVFIFIVYVCKKKTWKIIRSKLGFQRSSEITQSTSSTQTKDRTTTIPLENMHNRK